MSVMSNSMVLTFNIRTSMKIEGKLMKRFFNFWFMQ